MKQSILSLAVVLVLFSCQQKPKFTQIELRGSAQGSTFSIKYMAFDTLTLDSEVDSILKMVDRSLSTYKSNSLISAVNKTDYFPIQVDPMFLEVYKRSMQIAEETGGAFDPTVGPLVEMWGFGLKNRQRVHEAMVANRMKRVGYQRTQLIGSKAFKMPLGYKLDFNAIAQGYTVDLIAEFLQKQGVDRYMVEVGGETRAAGLNSKDEVWKIGIDKPSEELDEENRLQAIIELKNKALATSGNYRKFWVDEATGRKYAHTINPLTGYPAKNSLLSASIIAPNAMDADAYATVCMVYGLEKARQFIESKPNLEAMFVYTNEAGEWEVYETDGFNSTPVN